MAEKTEKKPAATAAAAPAAPAPAEAKPKASGGFLGRTPVQFGVVMVLEAALLFVGFKFLVGGSPQSAAGAHLASPEGQGQGGEAPKAGGEAVDPQKSVAVKILESRFTNNQSGKIFLYEVSIYAMVKGEAQKHVAEIAKDREPVINDRVRTIIGRLEPAKLGGGEPGLETLRRQVKYQLDEIVGEGIVEEILVPRCIPYRAD